MIDFANANVEAVENRLLPIKKLCEDGPQAFWLSAISIHTHKIAMSLRLYASPSPSLPKCLHELSTVVKRVDWAQQSIPGLSELSIKKRWELLKRDLWSFAEAIRDCQDEMDDEPTHANVNSILSQHLQCLEELYEHLCTQGRKEFGVS